MASKFLNISTDTTLGGSGASDKIVSSQKAVKAYVDAHSGGGGGAVTSVNGQTGVVVLTASDVGVDAYTANEVNTLWESI